MAFGQPQDDETPDYHPFLAAAAGIAPSNGQPAAQPVSQPSAGSPVPYYIAAPQGSAAPQQQTQAPTTTPAPNSGQAPASPQVVLPTAPQAPQVDMDRYHALEAQLTKDQQPNVVKPKWWERVAGAAVGFGAGYKGGAAQGVELGSRVTNRGQIQANEEQAARVTADKGALDQFNTENKLNTEGYENQLRSFGAQMQTATAQREQANNERDFNQRKSDSDRNFKRETDNDARSQSNADRSFNEGVSEFNTRQAGETADRAERSRENRFRDGLESKRVSIEQQRVNDAAGKDSKNTPTTVTPEQWQNLIKEREAAYAKQQTNRDEEMSQAKTQDDKDKVTAKYKGIADQMQDEWNRRLATADPKSRYAEQGSGNQPAQPAAPQNPQGNAKPNGQSVSLKAAMAKPFNKGKSADQVTADLKSRGYDVEP